MSDLYPTLPQEQLAERDDAEWEGQESANRLAGARSFALPLLIQILAAQELGANVEDDDQFSEMVDRLYDGVRDRLTRQDLLRAFLDPMGAAALKAAQDLVAQGQREVQALIGSARQ